MDEIGDYNLFVGGLSGVFKGLRITYLKGIHNIRNLQNIKEIMKRNELTVLNWGDDEETEILLGYMNQQVRIYDLQSKSFVFDETLQYGKGGICGISKYNGILLTGVGSGSICVWDSEELTNPTSIINTKGQLDRVRHSCANRNIVAAGGKENDLSLWNLETQQTVFQAKNVRHDELELRVPVWVSDMCFVPDTQKVAVCTRYGHVRLYDPSTPTRRPVVQVEVKDQAFMCIAVAPRDHHVVVGSGTGNMYLVDLRGKGVLLNHFRGFVGGIRQIVCTPSEPYVASVGLDRHIRIHNLNTKKLLHKEYLQCRLSCVLAKSSFTMSPDQVDVKQESELKQEAESVVDVGSDEEYETMFDNMDIIIDEDKQTTKRRNKLEDDLITDEKDSEIAIVKDATEKKQKIKSARQNKTVDTIDRVEDNLVKNENDLETKIVEDVCAENKKKVKNYGNIKKDHDANGIKNNLRNDKNYPETGIFTEAAAEKKEKIKNNRESKTVKDSSIVSVEAVEDSEINVFQDKDYDTKGKSNTLRKNVKEIVTELGDCEDPEIIEIEVNENTVETDEKVETFKVMKTCVEREDIEVIELDGDEDYSESDVEVETIKEFMVPTLLNYDRSHVEDDDSDVVEIDYEGESVRVSEMEAMKEITGMKQKSAIDWRNQIHHDVDEEGEDSDVIEIEREDDAVEMEVEKEGSEKEEALQEEGSESKCKADDMKEEEIDVTEVEEHANNNSEEETVKKVVTDKKKKTRKKKINKQKWNMNNAESQGNNGLEENSGSDKVENNSEAGKKINSLTDKVSDDSNIRINKNDSETNEIIKVGKNKNKSRNNCRNLQNQDNNCRNLRHRNKKNETDGPKAKRRKKVL